jgi:Flp pilus assembly protein TadG
MRLHRDERGQTIILVAFSLPLILGFIGLATDVGALFKDKRDIQTAADAAAIAGALNLNSTIANGTNASTTAAQNAAAANGFTNGSNGVIVTVNNPPTWPASNYNGVANSGNQGYVEVTVTKSNPTIFLSLFGYPSVTVLARAVATNTGPGVGCVFTLDPAASPALTVTSTLQSLAPQCGLLVDSNGSPPMNVAGILNMSSIGTVGNCDGGCGNTITPTPVPGIIPYSDPLAYLPQFTCNGASCTNGTTTYPCTGSPNLSQPLQPGCYNGISASGSAIILQPGTYVINGALNLAGGTLTGSNVTIIMASGALTLTGTVLNLSAPISGTYNGILFAQSSTDNNPATFVQSPTSSIQGFFYFPNSQLLLNSSFNSAYTGFVAQTITVSSPLTFTNYAALPGATSPITSAILVE